MGLTRSLLQALALAVLSTVAFCQRPEVRPLELPSILSDGCVLQRNDRVPVWGTATPGATVVCRTSWSRSTHSARVLTNGRWYMPISTPEASGPHEIAIKCGESVVRLKDVWIGEVWLASGQSNMEMPLDNVHPGYSGVLDYKEEIAAADFPKIRLFKVPNAFSLELQETCEAEWVACSSETVREFSSTAFFFGRELHRELDVPIGLISADFGGTPIESWLSPAALSGVDAVRELGDRLQAGGDDATLLAELNQIGSRAWADRVRVRDGQVQSDWIPIADWKNDDEWSGLIHLRCEVELESVSKRIELRIPRGAYWLDIACNGQSVASNAPQFLEDELPAEITLTDQQLKVGVNQLELALFTSADPGQLQGLSDQFGLRNPSAENDFLELSNVECRRGVELADFPRRPGYEPLSQHTPSGLYNAMIGPVCPYGIRGAIWYQGESNVDRPETYAKLLQQLAQSWRSEFFARRFAFYVAQISPFGYDPDRGRAGDLRDAQRAILELDNTGLVSTMDIGNLTDIHPKNKQEVGRRFARWALHQHYGRNDLVPSGPLPISHEVEDGALRVRFRYAEEGLVAAEDGLDHFELAGSDGVFHAAEARIDGFSIVLRSSEVAEPVAMRYAHAATDEATLFNRAGLPAPSFQLP